MLGDMKLRTKPLTTDSWPAFTTHSDDDVVIAALSIGRLVEWCGTPCVHTADHLVCRQESDGTLNLRGPGSYRKPCALLSE